MSSIFTPSNVMKAMRRGSEVCVAENVGMLAFVPKSSRDI
jgi:hypothetical protein